MFDKVAIIERCVERVLEEYAQDPDTFHLSLTRQDAAILNIQRACGAVLCIAAHSRWFRLPENPRHTIGALEFLAQDGRIKPATLESLRHMLDICDDAVRESSTLHSSAVENIIKYHLNGLLDFKEQRLGSHAKLKV